MIWWHNDGKTWSNYDWLKHHNNNSNNDNNSNNNNNNNNKKKINYTLK